MALDILRALALVLILEGILPFLSPGRSRLLFTRLAQVDERLLRLVGLSSMVVGLTALQLLHLLA